MRRIVDEFTNLKISRQRKWQLRRAKEGKCIKCGARVAVNSIFCVSHNVKTAVYNHERKYPGKKPLNSKWLKLASYNGGIPARPPRKKVQEPRMSISSKRMMTEKEAGDYVGLPALFSKMQQAGWIKSAVQRPKMKLYDLKHLDACCDRLSIGEFPDTSDLR